MEGRREGPAGVQQAGAILLMIEGSTPPAGYALVGTFVEERVDSDGNGGRRPQRIRVTMWRKLP